MQDESERRKLLGAYVAPEGLYAAIKARPFLGSVQCSHDRLVAGSWHEIVLTYGRRLAAPLLLRLPRPALSGPGPYDAAPAWARRVTLLRRGGCMALSSEFRRRLEGYGLTTAEILYHLPDHPHLLQTFVWQQLDLFRAFPS